MGILTVLTAETPSSQRPGYFLRNLSLRAPRLGGEFPGLGVLCGVRFLRRPAALGQLRLDAPQVREIEDLIRTNIAIDAGQTFRAFDDDLLQPLGDCSVLRDRFHVFIIEASGHLAVV